MVTYCYFFEATLSAEGGSYAQLAALIEKAMLMIKRWLFLLTTWDLYFLSGCGIAKGPDVGLLSKSDLGVIGIGAKHFY